MWPRAISQRWILFSVSLLTTRSRTQSQFFVLMLLKTFPSERLNVDKRRVTLNKKDQARVKEQVFLNSNYRSSPKDPFSQTFSCSLEKQNYIDLWSSTSVQWKQKNSASRHRLSCCCGKANPCSEFRACRCGERTLLHGQNRNDRSWNGNFYDLWTSFKVKSY